MLATVPDSPISALLAADTGFPASPFTVCLLCSYFGKCLSAGYELGGQGGTSSNTRVYGSLGQSQG